MKTVSMIVAIIVSIFSAQGLLGQEDLAENRDWEYTDYSSEVQEYTEIEVLELPMPIQNIIAKDFENFRIHRAYISKDNTYKIILKDENNVSKVVFASADGKWIKPDDKS